MVLVSLNDLAGSIIERLNKESRVLKVCMNLGGFAWVEDDTGVCVENGFCLIGNSVEVQKEQINLIALVLGVTVIII